MIQIFWKMKVMNVQDDQEVDMVSYFHSKHNKEDVIIIGAILKSPERPLLMVGMTHMGKTSQRDLILH